MEEHSGAEVFLPGYWARGGVAALLAYESGRPHRDPRHDLRDDDIIAGDSRNGFEDTSERSRQGVPLPLARARAVASAQCRSTRG